MPDRRQHRGAHPDDAALFGRPDALHTLAWPWKVLLVPNADTALLQTEAIIATSDSGILDAAAHLFDLAAAVVAQRVPQAWCVDLDVPSPSV
jgi:hypothetical protein